MLEFQNIKQYFAPGLVRLNPKGVLVEYLQYEFLDSIFKITGSEKLSFIGGTAIRIIHDNSRFSEDLDFDNFGLSFKDFKQLIDKACSEIKLKGFKIEVKFLKKDKNYHCYVKFPDILFQAGISAHKNEKVFVSIDAENKKKIFVPDSVSINKFGIFRKINVNPVSILLAQKLLAVLLRKREKGRDFYDSSFLAGKTKPDYNYIRSVTGLSKKDFTEKIIKHCGRLDYRFLAKDVAPFLFDADQADRVLYFFENLPAILG